ncbi:hypothetical protein R75461_07255 [Paraburkholderia nemoris]|nr:hypothetical protein R75461_07255 [Paraburkholderia nemoris]
MLLVATSDSVTVVEFKRAAKTIRKLSNRAIQHAQGLELLSRLFGYVNLHDATCNVNDETIANRRRDRDKINMKLFDVARRVD